MQVDLPIATILSRNVAARPLEMHPVARDRAVRIAARDPGTRPTDLPSSWRTAGFHGVYGGFHGV